MAQQTTSNNLLSIKQALNKLSNRTKPSISIVIPCLNEEESIGFCITQSLEILESARISGIISFGEIIVADNGSIDNSARIAQSLGAAVISIEKKGYGNALIKGIEHSTGDFILIGDADGSYDFQELPKFIEKYSLGHELIMGCRLPSGGGKIEQKAMPWIHRIIGNPVITMCSRFFYSTPVNDIYCGLRGLSRELYNKLDMQCEGMEFAVEMVVKTTMLNENIAQVPITLKRDRRIDSKPHLKTFQDGWRTLRYLLLSNPKLLFLLPGAISIATGILGYILVYYGSTRLAANSLLIFSLFLLLGVQSIFFGLFSTALGVQKRLILKEPRYLRIFRYATLGKGIFLAVIMVIFGLSCIASILYKWHLLNYSNLDYSETMLVLIPGITAIALAVTSMFSTFTISLLVVDQGK